MIPIVKESGILCLAFAFVDVVNEYGRDINEVSIDSTCECTSAGSESYLGRYDTDPGSGALVSYVTLVE